MASIADLSRPSTWLLLVVLVANVAAPALHFRPDSAAPVDVAEPRLAKPGPPVDPLAVPVAAKRVALRQRTPVCRAWGPFTDLADAEALAGRLALQAKDFEVFESRVEARPDHLVTVQVSGDREAVGRALKELEDQGVDSYVLERDDLGSVLAAGVFSTVERARAQQQRLDGLGYPADVQPLDRSHRVYHLLARIPADRKLETAPAGACGDIAPLEQFL